MKEADTFFPSPTADGSDNVIQFWTKKYHYSHLDRNLFHDEEREKGVERNPLSLPY